MILRIALVIVALAAPLAVAPAPAQQPAPAASQNGDSAQRATGFLKQLEEKHGDLATLTAAFTQTREDAFFGDKVTSNGRFWYAAPDRFRANYESDHSEQIWMLGDELISYVPTQKQVDIIKLKGGEEAPVHRLLLGFGAATDKIIDIFDVKLAEEQKEGMIGIAFHSKDLSRSMEYGDITIWFDEATQFPQIIIADDGNNVFTVELSAIKMNEAIKPGTFARDWPADDVDVIHRESF